MDFFLSEDAKVHALDPKPNGPCFATIVVPE
jgi:hypothetical protein